MLRLVLISGLATALLGGTALAADLPTVNDWPPPVRQAPAFSWTGFYIGVNGGYAGDEFRYPFSGGPIGGQTSVTGSASLNSSGFLGGGQIGYNYQFASLVSGFETDIDASSIQGKLNGNAGIVGLGSANLSAGSNLEFLGTARGRLGFAIFDQALLYATGGLAYGEVHSSYNVVAPGIGSLAGSQSSTNVGWTVGGGLEYALTNNLTFKTEYLYADLGKSTILSQTNFFGVGTGTLAVDTTVNIVRAGLNYRF
jgi:outer membrane immunogenic protein